MKSLRSLRLLKTSKLSAGTNEMGSFSETIPVLKDPGSQAEGKFIEKEINGSVPRLFRRQSRGPQEVG